MCRDYQRAGCFRRSCRCCPSTSPTPLHFPPTSRLRHVSGEEERLLAASGITTPHAVPESSPLPVLPLVSQEQRSREFGRERRSKEERRGREEEEQELEARRRGVEVERRRRAEDMAIMAAKVQAASRWEEREGEESTSDAIDENSTFSDSNLETSEVKEVLVGALHSSTSVEEQSTQDEEEVVVEQEQEGEEQDELAVLWERKARLAVRAEELPPLLAAVQVAISPDS